jgi:hypothetical protein
VRASVGVIDEQPPAGRSSVPERASNCTLQPATAALGGEAPKRAAWTVSWMISVPPVPSQPPASTVSLTF